MYCVQTWRVREVDYRGFRFACKKTLTTCQPPDAFSPCQVHLVSSGTAGASSVIREGKCLNALRDFGSQISKLWCCRADGCTDRGGEETAAPENLQTADPGGAVEEGQNQAPTRPTPLQINNRWHAWTFLKGPPSHEFLVVFLFCCRRIC